MEGNCEIWLRDERRMYFSLPGILVAIVLIVSVQMIRADVRHDTLYGDLPNLLVASKSPYIVVGDIFVPSRKSTKIEAGTVLLFKNFSGMHVQGTLYAVGTAGKPIVFSSENDSKYNSNSTMKATPYDWNGIYIHGDGMGSNLEHITVMHSVYGIVSETKFIRIDRAVFDQNGRSDVTIEGTKKEIGSGPYSYHISVKNALVDGVPVKILRDPTAPKRNFYRYSGVTFTVGGAILGTIYAAQWHTSERKLKKLSSKNIGNLTNYTNEDWQNAKNERDRNLSLALAGLTSLVAGTIGFSWSFWF